MKNINYAQVYGDEVDEVIKDSVNLPRHFSELSPEIQRLFEVAVDAGYQRAIEDALDPELLEETSTFSQEMSDQLSQFASFLDRFLNR